MLFAGWEVRVVRHCERGLYQTKDSIRLTNETLLKTIGQWLLEGSGWSIKEMFAHELFVAKCVPPKGLTYIKVPSEFATKKALINLQNEDDECYRWCHVCLVPSRPRDAN